MILVLEYPKCSTCKKALKWLEENEVPFTKRHIVEEEKKKTGEGSFPSAGLLQVW